MNKYYIFLILTDGLINDMDATIDEIVRATSLPISIIIVGVGSEDFTSMNV
jgi:vacuolar-type H+-ATPase subunit F/Vma7